VNIQWITTGDGRAERNGVAHLFRKVHSQESCQHAAKAVTDYDNRILRLSGDIFEPPAQPFRGFVGTVYVPVDPGKI
jgi:hypothetical protein